MCVCVCVRVCMCVRVCVCVRVYNMWIEYLLSFSKKVYFQEDIDEPLVPCTKTYTHKRSSRQKLTFLKDRIHEGYMQQWVVDNMPVTWCYSIMESNKPFCTTRFPVGCYVTNGGQRHDACFISVSIISPHNTYTTNNVVLIVGETTSERRDISLQ